MKPEFEQAISDIRKGWEQSWFWVKALLSNLQLAKALNAHSTDSNEDAAFDIVQAYRESYRLSRWWFHHYISEQSHPDLFDRLIHLSQVLANEGLFTQKNFKSLITHDALLKEDALHNLWGKIPARTLTQSVYDQIIAHCDNDKEEDLLEYITALSCSANVIPLQVLDRAATGKKSPVPTAPIPEEEHQQSSTMRHRRRSSTASVIGLLDGQGGNGSLNVGLSQSVFADDVVQREAQNTSPFSPVPRASSPDPEFDIEGWDQLNEDEVVDAESQRTVTLN